MSNHCASLLPFALVSMLAACGGGAGKMSLKDPGKGGGALEPRCRDASDGTEQLTVGWSPEERASLEVQARDGVVVVRYADCELSILPDCRIKEKYVFERSRVKEDRLSIDNDGQLESLMPDQARRLRGDMLAGGIVLQTSTIGGYSTALPFVGEQDLIGACAGATHFVASIAVGAFEMGTGPGAPGSAGPSAAEPNPRGRVLAKSGDRASCTEPPADAARPPERCSDLLRVELAPIGMARAPELIHTNSPPRSEPAPAPPATAPGVPPEGSLVRGTGTEIFVVEAGKLRHIPDPATFNAMGYDWDQVTSVTDDELSRMPRGEPLPRR